MPLLNNLASTFPAYIIPSIPFRRRSSAASTTTTTSSTLSASPPAQALSSSSTATAASAHIAQAHGREEAYLPTHTSLLRCNRCLAQISSTSQIVSKGFTGRHGRAYLVSPSSSTVAPLTGSSSVGGAMMMQLPNTNIGKPQQRQLVTGLHTVCDITCALCGSVLGWKYVAAEEEGQKYKVGKFILETKRVIRDMVWDGDGGGADFMQSGETDVMGMGMGESRAALAEETIEFDSQDEDECEDLFMGIWSEKLASKRRKDKAWRMEN